MRAPSIIVERLDGLGVANPRFAFDLSPWGVLKDGLENFDGVEHAVEYQSHAERDGGVLVSERSDPMDRTISAAAKGDIGALRRQAEAFFIPRREYRVHVEAEGKRVFCDGRQYAFRLTVDKRRQVQMLTWTVLCLDPMWQSEDEKGFDLVEARGHFGFPFLSFWEPQWVKPEGDEPGDRPGPAKAERAASDPQHIGGFVTGLIENAIEMVNAGDAPAYPVFTVSASDSVVNPSVKVVDASGATVMDVSFDISLKAGDVLVADFSKAPSEFALNGSDVSAYVSFGSTVYGSIDVGTFTLTWSAESGDAAMSIVPTIRERSVAI